VRRTRECTNPKPQGHGKPCEGPAVESKQCEKKKCIPDVDGGWTKWSDWTSCSKTCGVGVVRRTRECTNPKPQGHGKPCEGPAVESKQCEEKKCIPDVDGGWTKWSDWTPCGKTCGGGVMRRTRECTNPKPQGHGKPCEGPAGESKACAMVKCEPVHCEKKLDIGVVIDRSRSIGKANFKKVQSSLKELVDYLKVSPKGTHMGITLYSTKVEIENMLNGEQEASKVKEIIDNLDYDRGQTHTDEALELTATKMFAPNKGKRPDVPEFVILFTDGGNTAGKKSLREVVNKYYKDKLETIAVGIGSKIHDDELLMIAQGVKENVIIAHDFDYLTYRLNEIVKQACKKAK